MAQPPSAMSGAAPRPAHSRRRLCHTVVSRSCIEGAVQAVGGASAAKARMASRVGKNTMMEYVSTSASWGIV